MLLFFVDNKLLYLPNTSQRSACVEGGSGNLLPELLQSLNMEEKVTSNAIIKAQVFANPSM